MLKMTALTERMICMLDVLLDAVLDSLKTLPFLFGAFLLMEAAEKHYGKHMDTILKKSKWGGPLAGSILGCIPQCGFSVIASNLYAGGLITLGTLLSVYLSTSDEAIILLLADSSRGSDILKLMVTKVIIGIIAGYLVDLIFFKQRQGRNMDQICSDCHCEEETSILKPALHHTVHLFVWLLALTLILNVLMEVAGADRISAWLLGDTVFQPVLAALIGLIPNCAASVILTQLYLSGAISFASVVAGLCTGAGAGLLVLFKMNKDRKENLKVLGLLYVIAVIAEKIFGPGTDSKEHEHLTLHSFGKRSEFPSPVQLKALHEIKEAVLVKMGIEDLVIFRHAFPCGIRKKIGLVGEKADPPFDFRIFVYVFSVHHDAAGIRADHTAHDPKEGAFSRSIGPHQPENALFLDCGDDVVQGVCVGEFLIYTVNFYHRLLHTGSQYSEN